MADALQTMLALKSPSNMTPDAYTPNVSRNNVRVSAIRRFLGLPGQDDGSNSQEDYESVYKQLSDEQDADLQKKAEATAYPERIRGEYGIATEKIRAAAQTEAARATADRLAAQLQYQAANAQANRDSTTQRSDATRTATDARAAAARAATAANQQAARNETDARLYDTGKMHAPRPENEGLLSRYLFGPTQSTLDQQAAKSLRSGGGNTPPVDDVTMGFAQRYLKQYGNLDDASLQQVIHQNEPDATPEELQMLMNGIAQLRKR